MSAMGAKQALPSSPTFSTFGVLQHGQQPIDLTERPRTARKASPGARRSSTQYDSGSQGTLSSAQGAVANAPTRGAGTQTRPSKFWAGGKALALASSARCCREVRWLVRAIAGVASMAAANSAADRSLSLVI